MFLKKRIFVITFFLFFCFNQCSMIVYANENFNIESNNAIVMDIETGEILYEKKSFEKVQMASTTKIMTALLLSENRNKDDLIKVTPNAIIQPSSSVIKDVAFNLKTGDYLKADDVMKGLLMASGNDMAVMIAEDISSDQETFSYLMDKKAFEIGMRNSDFYTPSGLDTDDVLNGEKHYSTAFDMALLGIAAYNDEWVKENMGTKNATIVSNSGYSFQIENSNKNLNKNNCVGGKTGYTTKAQRCLVAFYEKDNKSLVGVVLGGKNPSYFSDMDKIMKYAFNIEPTILKRNGDVIDKSNFTYKKYDIASKLIDRDFDIVLREDIYIYDNEFNNKNIKYKVSKNKVSIWNFKPDSSVGTLEVIEPNSSREYNLYMDEDTIQTIQSAKIKCVSLFYVVVIGSVCMCFYNVINKKNKK